MMRVATIGAGYVGLVSGACLADLGHDVTCVDSDPVKLAAIEAGRLPIFEPGLDALIAMNRDAGRLRFTRDLAAAVAGAEVVLVAVGTPPRAGDGHADLSHVHAVAREIAPRLKGFTVVALKSTVPVGTGDAVARILREEAPTADVAVVSNPEFLREGAAITDFQSPDRIVVGAEDDRARAAMAALYRPLTETGVPLLFMSRRTSELTKYAANAFLAAKVAFVNEMADLCERAGADVKELAGAIGLDKRIGPKFLEPGPGLGGSCFPKDMVALMRTAQEHGVALRLVEATVAANDARKSAMARRIAAALGGEVAGRTVAILGLTFKPDTDDMRESPAIPIIRTLLDQGASVRAYDPAGMEEARKLFPAIVYAADPYACLEGADCAAIVTEWAEFRALDLAEMRRRLARPLVVDLRNVFRPDEMAAHGLSHFGVGRSPAPSAEVRALMRLLEIGAPPRRAEPGVRPSRRRAATLVSPA